MPAFASQLTDEQIAAISNYVTNHFGNPQASMTAEQVGKLRGRRNNCNLPTRK